MSKGIGGSSAAQQLAEIAPWRDSAPSITHDERLERIEQARTLMRRDKIDALLIGAGASLRYFAGVSWSASERLVAMLLPVSGRPSIISPAFEVGTLQAELDCEADLQLWEEDENPNDLVTRAAREAGASRLAIDPAMAFLFTERIRHSGPSLGLIDGSAIVDGCRMTKSASELALMRQAKQMTLEVQRRAALILREGIAASEVRRFIDEAHRAIGAQGSSFCIVQFGKSTAYPHGVPGDDLLSEGDVVLIDTGCTIHGYHSDITRTYVFGEPSRTQRDIWTIEQEAQQAAFDAAAPGVLCQEVDAAARRVLERSGLGPGYQLPGLPHRTGHGIGLSIHEPPYLVRGDETPLKQGMCFSNEPMIVMPERFGIRLEDHFYVTEDGAEWFTKPSPTIDAPFG